MFAARHIAHQLPPAEAIPALEAIDARLPGRYYLQFFLGLSRLNSGEPESALPHFRQALGLNPEPSETPSIYSYMGVALKETGRFAEALDCLNQGAALDPERTDIHNLMGFCHFKRGEHEQAVAAFQRVIELDPTSAIDYANLGVNLEALGESQKAIECFRMALRLDPAIEFARSHLERLSG
jgi:ribosomal protein S12 methylthiotransferase accessory factor